MASKSRRQVCLKSLITQFMNQAVDEFMCLESVLGFLAVLGHWLDGRKDTRL